MNERSLSSLPFRVEQWDANDHVTRLFAAADNALVGMAAFRQAVLAPSIGTGPF
jgi:hypothetical protein